jgi:hypothetical protein
MISNSYPNPTPTMTPYEISDTKKLTQVVRDLRAKSQQLANAEEELNNANDTITQTSRELDSSYAQNRSLNEQMQTLQRSLTDARSYMNDITRYQSTQSSNAEKDSLAQQLALSKQEVETGQWVFAESWCTRALTSTLTQRISSIVYWLIRLLTYEIVLLSSFYSFIIVSRLLAFFA